MDDDLSHPAADLWINPSMQKLKSYVYLLDLIKVYSFNADNGN